MSNEVIFDSVFSELDGPRYGPQSFHDPIGHAIAKMDCTDPVFNLVQFKARAGKVTPTEYAEFRDDQAFIYLAFCIFEDFTARTSKSGRVLRENQRENMVEADAAISRSDHIEKIKSILLWREIRNRVVKALADSDGSESGEDPISTSKFSLSRAIHVYESLKPRMKALVDPFKCANEDNYIKLCARFKKPNI
ncbi:hypothetical protein Ciccas_001346 [Cichlidogyrus casuarinus]|uniref:Uncharacterized protein n=1 Tax=Cichlidogyrus casuarinus TaxID=1844966 RepID=A0ABD2QKJ8_9PLAT